MEDQTYSFVRVTTLSLREPLQTFRSVTDDTGHFHGLLTSTGTTFDRPFVAGCTHVLPEHHYLVAKVRQLLLGILFSRFDPVAILTSNSGMMGGVVSWTLKICGWLDGLT